MHFIRAYMVDTKMKMCKASMLIMLCLQLQGIQYEAQAENFGVYYNKNDDGLYLGGDAWHWCAPCEDRHNLINQNLSNGTRHVVWKAEYGFRDVQFSTNGFLSFIEYSGEDSATRRQRLTIINIQEDKIFSRISDVQFSRWSPDGKSIAYITGQETGQEGGYMPTGTYILSLASNISERICEKGYDLYWAAFDGDLYIRAFDDNYDFKIMRYDIDEKKLEPTDYNAIDFSPNGKYYFVDTAMMEVPMQLYLRSNNKDIIGTERNSIPPKIAWGLYAEKWLNDDLILVHPSFLPRAKSESGYFTNDIILDIKNKQLYVTQDKVIDIRNNGKDVVMVKLSPEHLELIYRLDRCTIVIKALKSLEAVSFQSMEKQIVPPEDLYMQYLNEKTSLPPEGPKTAPPPSPRRHGFKKGPCG